MSEVKKFRITGDLRKRGENLHFKKEIRALKKEDALQGLYASRHKARKFEIIIKTVEEVPETGDQA